MDWNGQLFYLYIDIMQCVFYDFVMILGWEHLISLDTRRGGMNAMPTNKNLSSLHLVGSASIGLARYWLARTFSRRLEECLLHVVLQQMSMPNVGVFWWNWRQRLRRWRAMTHACSLMFPLPGLRVIRSPRQTEAPSQSLLVWPRATSWSSEACCPKAGMLVPSPSCKDEHDPKLDG